MLRAPLPTTLNYNLAIHSNDSFWTVQKDQASLTSRLSATAARPVQTGRLPSYLDRMLDELFIDRMEGNEEIFARAMTDKEFRSAAHEHLAREIFRRVRGSA
jgi:hypothetical protein